MEVLWREDATPPSDWPSVQPEMCCNEWMTNPLQRAWY